MAKEWDRETTLSPTDSSKDHLNGEKIPQNNFWTLAEDTRHPERQPILFKRRLPLSPPSPCSSLPSSVNLFGCSGLSRTGYQEHLGNWLVAHRTKDRANSRWELAGCGRPRPMPEAERQARDNQSWKVRSNIGPSDGILHQTSSRLPVAIQVFLGSWTVDNLHESWNQRSAPQSRHTAHQRWH